MKPRFPILLSILLLLAAVSCRESEKENAKPPGLGAAVYEPVYESDDIRKVEVMSSRSLVDVGQIHPFGNYILINEKNAGLHVFDNSNPGNPQNIAFISIPGNNNVHFNGTTMYADNYNDVLAIDISDIHQPRIRHRYKDMMYNDNWQLYPPATGKAFFDCPDEQKGRVVGWSVSDKTEADCFK